MAAIVEDHDAPEPVPPDAGRVGFHLDRELLADVMSRLSGAAGHYDGAVCSVAGDAYQQRLGSGRIDAWRTGSEVAGFHREAAEQYGQALGELLRQVAAVVEVVTKAADNTAGTDADLGDGLRAITARLGGGG